MIHCPSCAAGLRFDIDTQKMHCDYCGNYYDVENIKDSEKDDSKSNRMMDTYVYTCPSCGGELLTTDKNDAVGFCPYCGGQSMLFDRVRQQWRPMSVIPFALNKDACKDAYTKEVKKHIFVSGKYKDPSLIDGFRGIYMPYWSSESSHKGEYKVSVKTSEKNIGNNDYKTEFYNAVGNIDYTVNGYAHDAAVAFDDHMSENIAPFDIRGEKEFHPGYLSGFYAEVGDADTREYMTRAEKELRDHVASIVDDNDGIHKAIRAQKLHDDDGRISVPVKIEKVNSVMYPVWFMSYRNRDRITYAAVNGQTGKVNADLPLSPFRILVAALLIFSAIFGALLLFRSSLPSLPATSTLGVCAVIAAGGMYFMLKSYINTICDASSGDAFSRSAGTGFLFIILTALATLGVIMYTTDGSYEGSRGFFGMIFGALGLLGMILSYFARFKDLSAINKAIKSKKDVTILPGVVTEGTKLSKYFSLIMAVTLITSVISLLIAFFNFGNKYFSYVLCCILALELIAYAFVHIHFQANVAKRSIPQFRKKGAYSDENN